MRCTVTWHPDAQSELACIWLDASERQAVADAANEIDRELSQDPDQKGEEFYGDRLFVALPLAVTYAVFPDDLRVQILQVWHQ